MLESHITQKWSIFFRLRLLGGGGGERWPIRLWKSAAATTTTTAERRYWDKYSLTPNQFRPCFQYLTFYSFSFRCCCCSAVRYKKRAKRLHLVATQGEMGANTRPLPSSPLFSFFYCCAQHFNHCKECTVRFTICTWFYRNVFLILKRRLVLCAISDRPMAQVQRKVFFFFFTITRTNKLWPASFAALHTTFDSTFNSFLRNGWIVGSSQTACSLLLCV